jgi:hypothetical protein
MNTTTASREVLRPYGVSPHGVAASDGQSFHPQPPASSGFLNLLTLSHAPCLPVLFRTGSALGVRSPGLCSSHAAVRRLQRRSPLAVDPIRRTPRNPPHCHTTEVGVSPTDRYNVRPRNIPRLQGLAPHESPPPRPSGLDPIAARSPPEPFLLQGIPPR